MIRALLLCCALAGPAAAWEFTPGQPCILTHAEGDIVVELTYDPTAPLYTISVTQPQPFVPEPIFAMEFLGPASLIISTGSHVLSNGGRTLTVTDRGFGNVLDGLQYNAQARAMLGGQSVTFSLDGASAPVAAFRACEGQPQTS